MIVAAAALSAALSHPPNKLVKIVFVSMCPPGQARRVSRLRCPWGPPWARNDLDGAPHPHRDQVHTRLAQFRPRVRNPPLCQGESGLAAVVTISIGFGCPIGLARGPAYALKDWQARLSRLRRDNGRLRSAQRPVSTRCLAGRTHRGRKPWLCRLLYRLL